MGLPKVLAPSIVGMMIVATDLVDHRMIPRPTTPQTIMDHLIILLEIHHGDTISDILAMDHLFLQIAIHLVVRIVYDPSLVYQGKSFLKLSLSQTIIIFF